jgi:hypothetical protein
MSNSVFSKAVGRPDVIWTKIGQQFTANDLIFLYSTAGKALNRTDAKKYQSVKKF